MQVAVYNGNIYPYKEKFRDEEISIPSKGHIMMDNDEAVLFLGTMNRPVLDADGNHTPEGFKMLKILGAGEAKPVDEVILRCAACNNVFGTEGELQSHILASHVNQLDNKEEAVKMMEKEKMPTIEDVVRKRKTAKT